MVLWFYLDKLFLGKEGRSTREGASSLVIYVLLPGHVAAAAVVALYHHAGLVAGHEVPVLHVVRTRVATRAPLTLTPGWTGVKEVEVGAEARDITRAVHEVHGVVTIVIIGH